MEADRDGGSWLFIGGYERSGSTVLERYLGADSSYTPIGELRYFFSRGVLRDEVCSCGEIFSRCPMWREVVRVAFGSVDSARSIAFELHANGIDRIRLLLRPPPMRRDLLAAVAAIRRLHSAIDVVCGPSIKIDSSKYPSWLFLSLLAQPQGRVLVIRRDLAGTIESKRRTVVRPEVPDETVLMPSSSALRTWLDWTISNGLVQRVSRTTSRPRFIEYADFAAEPLVVAQGIDRWLGLNAVRTHESSCSWYTRHSIGGNPNRFERGELVVKPQQSVRDSYGVKALERVSRRWWFPRD